MEFKEFKISELGDVITGFTPSKKENLFGDTIPFLTPNDMNGSKFEVPERSLNLEAISTKNNKLCSKDSVSVSCIGSQMGKVTFNKNPLFTNQQINTISNIKKEFDPHYIYYQLTQMREYFHSISSGSTMPIINKSIFSKIVLNIPNLKNQKKISSILSIIDEKVVTNRETIANLEELSQTLFKRWFVDFEFPDENGLPYTSSNKRLEVLPPLWEKGSIDNIGTIIAGGTPSKKIPEYFTDKGISWLTPKDLSNNKNKFIYKGENDITELGLQKSSAKLMPKNTVLFSSRAPIGYIALAGKEVTTNQGFKSIIPNKGYNSYFIYFLLKNKLSSIEKAAGGSTFKEISGKSLKQIEILIPPKYLVCEFEEIVSPYFEKIKSLELENNSLIELRDTLLPKLMSGEIELADTLEVTEDAELLQRG